MKAIIQSQIPKVRSVPDSPNMFIQISHMSKCKWLQIEASGTSLIQLRGDLVDNPMIEFPIYWFEDLTFLRTSVNIIYKVSNMSTRKLREKHISVKVTEELDKKIRGLAKKEDRTVSYIVDRILCQYFQNNNGDNSNSSAT